MELLKLGIRGGNLSTDKTSDAASNFLFDDRHTVDQEYT